VVYTPGIAVAEETLTATPHPSRPVIAQWLLAAYTARFRIVLYVSVLVLTLLAWSHRFVQDDAFIGFRYAYNLAQGRGLVWNEGERVEGYTNFLYTLAMSLPIWLGVDPVRFSFLFGLLTFVLSLTLTYGLARYLLRSRDAALVTVILLGTNYTFSCFATSGMETQLQACLFLASLYTVIRSIDHGRWEARPLIMLSLLLSAAVLTRLDSTLLLAVVLPVALVCSLRAVRWPAERAARALYLLAPLCLLVGAWLIWKARYYGDILPNTYYVKASSYSSLTRGATYVSLFFQSYWLIVFLLFLLWFAKGLTRPANRTLLIPLAVSLLWLLYTAKVGGDFLEFRFLVPVLPLFFVLIGWIIFVQVQSAIVRVALVALTLAGSLHHAYAFTDRPLDIESITDLSGHLRNDGDAWVRVGQVLGSAFDHDPAVTVAVTAGGAIPYYSRLTTIDMLGLNDRWIARNGLHVGSRPGHQRMATLEYLIERRTNLVISHPLTVDLQAGLTLTRTSVLRFLPMLSDSDRLPSGVSLLEIPIDSGRKLIALYLVTSPRVDAAIATHGWRRRPYDLWDTGPPRRPEPAPVYEEGDRIAFATGQGDGYLWYGWSGLESGIRWSTGNAAAIVLGLRSPGPRLLRIEMGRFLYGGPLQGERVKVELNGTPVATLLLTEPESKEYSIVLPGHLVRTDNVLRFVVTEPEGPTGGHVPMRRLGLSLHWMQLSPIPHT
jgi:arabinofuranosyltransferase